MSNEDKKGQTADSRITLARALMASWLNWIKGTPAPIGTMQRAIDYLIANTPDENGDGKGDGRISIADASFVVPSSSSLWTGSCNTATACKGYQGPGAETLKNILDQFNNVGLTTAQATAERTLWQSLQ